MSPLALQRLVDMRGEKKYNETNKEWLLTPNNLSRRGIKEMWIFYAIGSSFFAGITAILAKCGIKKTDSNVVTAIRTVVVLLFSWLMVLITGTWGGIRQIDGRTLLFLVLSGLATGASWLCYFHALQKGDINKVVPIDKSSTVLSILLAFIFLHEGISGKKIIFVYVFCSRFLVS